MDQARGEVGQHSVSYIGQVPQIEGCEVAVAGHKFGQEVAAVDIIDDDLIIQLVESEFPNEGADGECCKVLVGNDAV